MAFERIRIHNQSLDDGVRRIEANSDICETEKKDLMEFIKATSSGHEFEPAYEVERAQIIRAFEAFLAGSSAEFELKESDAIKGNVHEWDDYFRIDVGVYFKDIELIRALNTSP